MNRVLDLEALIPTHLQEDPLLAFKDSPGCVDTTTANACLRLYIVRTKQRAVSREDFRNRLEDTQAGIKALSWFLSSGHHENLESIDVGLLNATCFCIVGGHSTSIWWELPGCKHEPFANTPNSDPGLVALTTRRWKSALLRGLIETQAYWSTGTNMFNEPLESFLEVDGHKGNKSISAAYSWMLGNMTFADKTGIDVGKYDDFFARTFEYKGLDRTDGLIDKGCLELMHPTRPNPKRLLGLFCDSARELLRKEALDMKSPLRFKLLSVTLAQHVNRTGNTTAARAVVKSAMEILRRGRRPSDYTSDAWGGRVVKRRASKREIEEGVKVDANGYKVPTTFVGSLEDKNRTALYIPNHGSLGGSR